MVVTWKIPSLSFLTLSLSITIRSTSPFQLDHFAPSIHLRHQSSAIRAGGITTQPTDPSSKSTPRGVIRSVSVRSSYHGASRSLQRRMLSANNNNENGGDEGAAGTNNREMSDVDEYLNPATAFLANFMQSSSPSSSSDSVDDPLSDIDFNAPKSPKMSLEDLAATLDAELYEKEWFVTGKVNPVYFADEFQFQDPDVKLTGIEEYARGVLKIFDQSTSRAQIISTVVDTTVPNIITCTWRLSGRVNIGPNGLPIKPYICYTDFTVDDKSGLVVFQEDRFDIPGWDILLSALFPFLVGKVPFLKEEAPEVEKRVVTRPKIMGEKEKSGDTGIFGGLFQKLGL